MIQSDDLYDLTADVSGSSLYDLTDKDGNRSLYISVVLQAILDVSKPTSNSEDSSFQVHRDQAHSWLFKEVGVTCQDFEEICFYAGLEPSVVRKFTSNIINSEDVNNVRRSIHALL
jgi:hypothetical protein|tara:strand:- start:56 stop:403 length:348 start_codon:yes stop_codon:yes gene_type:complete